MQLNQFSRLTKSQSEQITELQRIHLLPKDFTQLPFQVLAQDIFQRLFPEAHSQSTQSGQLSLLQATTELNLTAYLETIDTSFDQVVFYNVALQLLGFEMTTDFELDQPTAFMAATKLPFIDQAAFDQTAFIEALYLLLTTRSQTGLLYLDQLANRGFFADWQSDQPQFLIFNGKVQPVFDTSHLIREVVYVESSLDTDQDGQRDLLETTIFRPRETEAGLKIPALYTASPYYKGINDVDADLHNVDTTIATKPVQQPNLADLTQTPTTAPLPQPRAVNGTSMTTEINATDDSNYSLNDYFLARGFANVYAGGIGTRGSDGVRTCGSPEETASTTAIIEWLAGNRRAFTNRTDGIEIKAWWCNHQVAMTGKSYLGTLATAAATTGVEGLRTIVAEAAISSWYDYYRENGLVVAPIDCQGEDADVLAKLCQTRQKDAADHALSGTFFADQLKALQEGQDRITGNYNAFWAARNYRDNLANLNCDVILVHGLNDWNVKLQNAGALWDLLRDQPVNKKLFLHQGEHIYMNNIQSIDFTDMMNLWFTHQLLGVENQAVTKLPAVTIQDNAQEATWTTQADWLALDNPTTTFWLNEQTLSTNATENAPLTTFKDDGVAAFRAQKISTAAWQDALIADQSSFTGNRLRFLGSPLTEPLIIDGRIQFRTRVAVNAERGLLSVLVIDYGQFNRLGTTPAVLAAKGQQLGYQWRYDDLKEFKLNRPSNYQVITKGHINLQNRHNSYQTDAVTPNEFYDITLDLQPTHYDLTAGHQLGLLVYATDMGMTIREEQAFVYQVDLAASQLIVPHLND